jgi:hypothetical protein
MATSSIQPGLRKHEAVQQSLHQPLEPAKLLSPLVGSAPMENAEGCTLMAIAGLSKPTSLPSTDSVRVFPSQVLTTWCQDPSSRVLNPAKLPVSTSDSPHDVASPADPLVLKVLISGLAVLFGSRMLGAPYEMMAAGLKLVDFIHSDTVYGAAPVGAGNPAPAPKNWRDDALCTKKKE